MKTTPIVLALLLPVILSFSQPPYSKALKIGDEIPDLTLKMSRYLSPTVRISDFKGKLLILDFWATWCQPCRAFLKSIDSLKQKFGDKIQIIPVSDEDSSTVATFLQRLSSVTGMNVASAYKDRDLQTLFPHCYIPHEVWISPDQRVLAITDDRQVNPENITSTLNNNIPAFITKIDPRYAKIDLDKPVLFNPGGTKNLFIPDSSILLKKETGNYRLLLTRDLRSLMAGALNQPYFYSGFNQSIPQFFQFLLGKGAPEFVINNRTIIEVSSKDSSLVCFPSEREAALKWEEQNRYCLEIVFPDSVSQQQKFDSALAALNQYLQPLNITGTLEERDSICWVLTITDSSRIKSTGGTQESSMNQYGCHLHNYPFCKWFLYLETHFLVQSPIPLIDDTHLPITFNMDIDLTCNLSDIDSINTALGGYGLQFIQKRKKIPFVVIKNITSISK